MANIYDVAKLAGVSIGTVSNYLNQKYVGAARSEAIRAAIDALHYTPNHVARSLKAQSAPQLTMVLPNLSEGTYATLAETVVHDMNACGYQVTLAFSDNSPAEEKRILNGCFSSMCAGVLLCTSYPQLMPTTGSMPGIKAFTAAVFGGIGSIPGAMLGGILLGIIEIFAKAYISTELSDAIVFAVLIIVLLVKPTGLLGKKIREKV